MWRVVLAAAEKKQKMEKAKAKPDISDLRNISKMSDAERSLWRNVQQTVEDVTIALSESYSLNTMISDMIKLTNALNEINETNTAIRADFQILCAETLVKLIAPVAPAVAEECWKVILSSKGVDRSWASVFDTSWPEVDDRGIFELEDIKCAVQVDGKTRFVLDIPGATVDNKDELIKLVMETPEGKRWVQSKIQTGQPSDVIVAPGGRVINFVFKKKTPRKAKT